MVLMYDYNKENEMVRFIKSCSKQTHNGYKTEAWVNNHTK